MWKIFYLLVLCYDVYLTLAFYKFTKDDKSKVSWFITVNHGLGTLLIVLGFYIFKWYLAIAIPLITIVLMGFLSSSIGNRVDEILFKNQKPAIILNFILNQKTKKSKFLYFFLESLFGATQEMVLVFLF